MGKVTYTGIDIAKLICAILIAYMHCYCFEPEGAIIKNILSPIGVPFFFIVSGFFYAKGLRNQQKPELYFRKYIIRIIKMYLAWTLITLPVAWYNLSLAHGDYSVLLKCIYLVRCLFLTGSIGIYWYLLALIYNSVILYYTYINKKEGLLYFCSILFFIIGILYEGNYLNGTIIEKIIHITIGSERNFLNVGLFYMCLGYYLSNKQQAKLPSIALFGAFIISLIITYFVLNITHNHFMQAISAFILFLASCRITAPIAKGSTIRIRKISTAIYLGHFPFILLFDYYLRRGTIINLLSVLFFSISLYLFITRLLPNKVSTTLYG